MTSWPQDPQQRQVAFNVRVYLADQRKTQQDLADALGVSMAWVSRRLTGRVVLPPLEALAIAGALGMSREQLYAQTEGGAVSSATSPA